MSNRKRFICLILGPVIFALSALLLRDLFTTFGAQAIGISLWMIFWWITGPVDITITALIPAIANAFLNNGLSLSRLERAMALGNLGEQVVVRSEKAFSRLVFEGFETADRTVYYPRKMARDHEARAIYREELKLADLAGDYTISDIMREDWRADDARLRRVVFE